MAPSTTTSGPKRKRRPAFSPPRPKATPKASKSKASTPKPTSSTKRRGRPLGSSTTTPSHASASAPVSVRSSSPSSSPSENSEPDFILAEVTHADADSTPPISHDLIQRIMHQAFREPEKTTMSTTAKAVIGKYVEIFVREAIARCAFERQEKEKGDEDGDLRGGDGWLEVEDLEKSAPQLVLDF